MWNDADFLETCLAALTAQTRPADEIIVVDNNSTDDTAGVAARYGVRLIRQPLQGIAASSAAGFDAATGDLIGRLDADSVPPPDWVDRIVTLSIEAGPLTIVTGPGDFYGAGRVTTWLGRAIYLGSFFRGFQILLGHAPVFGSNFMMSRQLWLRVRGSVHRDVRRLHDDIDLSYQLEPDMTVLLEPTLRVAISGRPLQSFRAFARRSSWVESTLRLNFREKPPLARLRARRRWALDSRKRRAIAERPPNVGGAR